MTRAATERLTGYILALAVFAAVLLYLVSGERAGLSAAIGGGIAVANWLMLRFIVGRVVDGNVKRQLAFSFVTCVKLGGLLAVCYWLLRSAIVEPIPFILGLSALVSGPLLGSFVHILTASAVESER
jgi:hypothetical protein